MNATSVSVEPASDQSPRDDLDPRCYGEISDRIPALPGIIGIYPGNGTLHITVLYEPSFGHRSGLQPHDIMNECLRHPVVRRLAMAIAIGMRAIKRS